MSASVFKFLPFAAALFVLSLGFFSCEKENVDIIEEEEEMVVPEEENALSFRLRVDGEETINVTQQVDSNEECLFGQFIAGDPDMGTVSSFLIGNGNAFQVMWTSEETGPHTFTSPADDPVFFIMINPCTDEPGDPIALQNYTVELETIGELGELMTGTFSGESLDIASGNATPISGSFSVPRIEY